MDGQGNFYILEINSMASLGLGGSYVYAAEKVGLDYSSLTNRLIESTTRRYFGTVIGEEQSGFPEENKQAATFNYLTQNRDKLEEELKNWTNLPDWTGDPVGLGASVKQFEAEMKELGMLPVRVFTNRCSAWTWQTGEGMEGGTLLVAPLDVPREGGGGYPIPFCQDSEWLYGEGIASSRAGITCILQSLKALKVVNRLQDTRLGIFIYVDEGRGMRYSSHILQQAAQHAGRVIVMMPGFRGGSVVDQRRGSRKFSIVVEGAFQRIGFQGDLDDVQEVSSERYSMLLPHRVRATVYVTFLDPELADEAEEQLRALFTSKAGEQESLRIHMEKLEERPPLNRSEKSAPIISRLRQISKAWKLPFGVESGLLPSPAGEIPPNIPVICGFGPASQNLFTPHEGIHRGELLQRILLLTLFLMGNENEA